MADQGPERIDFSGLVSSLAASAVALFAQVESLVSGGDSEATAPDAGGESGSGHESLSAEEKGKAVQEGLSGARQIVDILGVLETKTAGNLTNEEQQLLSSVLTELRIGYARVSARASSTSGEEG